MKKNYYYVNENKESRFATIKEFKEKYEEQNLLKTDSKKRGGPPVAVKDGGRYYLPAPDLHSLIFAGTGAGKSESIMEPTALSYCSSEYSIFINDVKSEYFDKLSKHFEQNGYKIYCINLVDSSRTDAYNFLLPAYELYMNGNVDEAVIQLGKISSMLMKSVSSEQDRFWETSSANYLTSLFLLLYQEAEDETQITLQNAYKIHLEGSQKEGSRRRIQNYFELQTEPKTEKARELANDSVNSAQDTFTSISAVMGNAFSKILRIASVCRYSSFKAEDLINEKSVIFLLLPDEAAKEYSAFTSVMIDQLYFELVRLSRKNNRRLERGFRFLIDEASFLCDGISSYLCASRSRNIFFCLALQNIRILGTEEKTILENSGNIIYLHSSSYETREWVSKMTGTYKGAFGEDIPLLSPQELACFDWGDALVLSNRFHPLLCKKLPPITKYNITLGSVDLPYTKKITAKPFSFIDTCEKLKKLKIVGQFPEKINTEKTEPKKESTQKNSTELFDAEFRAALEKIETGMFNKEDLMSILNDEEVE